TITPVGIVAYVLLDARFPASIRYSIERCEDSLRALCRRDRADDGSEAERCAGRLLASLVHSRAPELVTHGLHVYLTGLLQQCDALHQAIVHTFFSHLAWRSWEPEPDPSPLAAPGRVPAERVEQTMASAQ